MRELFWPIFIGALHREIIQILFGLAIWLSRLTAVRQYDFVINFSPPRAIARGSVNGSSLASSAQKYNKKNNRQERRIINNTPSENKFMSYTSGIRQFKERPVHVTCPACSCIADQKAGKLRKDAILHCPQCGLHFRPSECWCIGG